MNYKFALKIPKSKSKYGNVKTFYNGVVYESKREADCARDLDTLKKAVGKERIESIERQVPFLLQNKFTDNTGTKHREIKYIADFKVKYTDGREAYVESKGMRTDVYKIKLKLLLYKYPDITFIEM